MGVSPVCDIQDFFFQKLGSVTFVTLWCSNFMLKIRKNSVRSLSYLKTDGGTTKGEGWLLRTPSGKPGVQNRQN